jgi:hypothetical protein
MFVSIQTYDSAAKMWYIPRDMRHRPQAWVKHSGTLWDDDAVFQGAGWVN